MENASTKFPDKRKEKVHAVKAWEISAHIVAQVTFQYDETCATTLVGKEINFIPQIEGTDYSMIIF